MDRIKVQNKVNWNSLESRAKWLSKAMKNISIGIPCIIYGHSDVVQNGCTIPILKTRILLLRGCLVSPLVT